MTKRVGSLTVGYYSSSTKRTRAAVDQARITKLLELTPEQRDEFLSRFKRKCMPFATGARFRVHKNKIHLELQQGILTNGTIDPQTVTWKEATECKYSKKVIYNFRNGVTFGKSVHGQRIDDNANIDSNRTITKSSMCNGKTKDLVHVSNFLVASTFFIGQNRKTQKRKDAYTNHYLIAISMGNRYNGFLEQNIAKSYNTFIHTGNICGCLCERSSNDNFTPRGALFGFAVYGLDIDEYGNINRKKKTKIGFNQCDHFSRTTDILRQRQSLVPPTSSVASNIESKGPCSYHVLFGGTSFEMDKIQHIVPFIDMQEVVTQPPKPIHGIGWFHKGYPGTSGYLSLKVFVEED
ncbi:hypothetical protein KQX54_018220 [Cotesia glomerata]|uniref:Uncharacterized protein n=1 Tax=Cotesia glomerata TaxID=32391 RepID=A0AAV7HWY5_COTGL|nr:hypothetical protein KQX54_018220 [Cotesia glomerata]